MFEYSNEPALEYVNSFSHSGSPVRDLSRIKKLMKAVGDPQDRLRFVHIAGTNGKGSVASMFAEVFRRAGLKTGLFTSPFIIEYADRIRVNGENIPYETIAELSQKVKAAVDSMEEKEQFSQFEVTQAIAFLYFELVGCDIVVLETGLGGLLDCTNVIRTPMLTVITSVDLDHTAILGDTVEKIAAQKAGIIKEGVPCILSAENCADTVRVVSDKANEMGSQLTIPEINALDIHLMSPEGSRFRYRDKEYSTSMWGRHQVINALSVIEGCGVLKEELKLEDKAVIEGIAAAKLCGRTEVISRAPLTILDGGHNPDGIRALTAVISGRRPCHAIIGMCMDKNISEALRTLIPYVDSFVAVDGFSDRAENAQELAELINSLGGCARAARESLAQEIAELERRSTEGLALICGSLYLVSAVHEIIDE